jgi:D-glycero-D-manno-heptose 1,7-bisphosphate phosphatase
MNRSAVYVDRDNTLIHDPGYLRDPDQVRLLDGVADGVKRLRDAGHLVIVASNQSGVARGLLTEADVMCIHARIQELLHHTGTQIDAFYFCPYLPGDEAVQPEYRVDSDLRKPRPGMLFLAAREHAIDLSRSWMVGDSPRDAQAGRAAGCRTILISKQNVAPDAAVDFNEQSFTDAVTRILATAS